MKKTIAAMLTAALTVASLAGCGKAENKSDATYLKDMDLTKLVTLGEYKGVTVEVESPNVTDSEVESYLQYVSSSMAASVEVTDRPVQEGDTVNIDYAGRYADSGEAFDGGTAEGYDLVIGSHSFIDGFEDGLIGANVGDTLDLNLTFPEDYGKAELAGVAVIFTVKVNKISVKPDLDDAYAASLGIEGVSNLEELKTYIKNKLAEDKQSTYETEIQNEALEVVTNGCMFENPPQAMLDRFSTLYVDQMDKVASYYSANYGTSMSSDSVVQMLMAQEGYTGEAEDYKSEKALELAKQYIMLGAIAQQEGIEVTEDELNEKLNSDMAAANASAAEGETIDSLDAYKATVDVENLKENMLSKKVLEFLAENANVVEPSSDDSTTTEASEEASEEESTAEDAAAEENTEDTEGGEVSEEITEETTEETVTDEAEATESASDAE